MSEKYISHGDKIAARALAGEMMVMSVTDSTLFSLNEVASLIWNAADGRTPLSEIVARAVVPAFEVDPETAYKDALEFVEELARHGILRVTDEPVSGEGV